MRNGPSPSEGVSQPVEGEPLTDTGTPSVQDDNDLLVRNLVSDPDFVAVARRWSHLSDELKEAVLRLVT